MKGGLSLKWQAVLIALGALLISHVIAIAVYSFDREDAMNDAAIVDVATRMSNYVEIAEGLDPEARREMLRRADGRLMAVSFGEPARDDRCKAYGQKAEVDRLIALAVPAEIAWSSCLSRDPPSIGKRLAVMGRPVSSETLRISFVFPDGVQVTFDGLVREEPPFLADVAVLYILVVGLVAAVTAYSLILRATEPLSRFGEHAAEIGRNLDSPPLPEDGPEEVRFAARAFNRMHAQLKRLVHGRTEMLAAISHDLRTPIARLRLRTELLPDTPDRTKLMATLAEMEDMVNAVLAFIRGAAPQEPERTIEMTSFVDSICSDMADAGMPVALVDSWKEIRFSCRPLALRRALQNLIDNAVKYAGSVEVRLRDEASHIVIEVLDRGPGLGPEQIDKVIMPFYRGEISRNRETGGHGLGLSIASSIANAHGGELQIRNRDGGGLEVSLRLPR